MEKSREMLGKGIFLILELETSKKILKKFGILKSENLAKIFEG
jgi:hypothetical protein